MSEIDKMRTLLSDMADCAIQTYNHEDWLDVEFCVFCGGTVDDHVEKTALKGLVVHEKDCSFIKARALLNQEQKLHCLASVSFYKPNHDNITFMDIMCDEFPTRADLDEAINDTISYSRIKNFSIINITRLSKAEYEGLRVKPS